MEQLFGVLIGGVIALMGGIIGQITTHQYTRHREREKLIREKAEAILLARFKHAEWIGNKRRMLWNGKEHDEADPSDLVSALNSLYFPECGNVLGEYFMAAAVLIDFIFSEGLEYSKDVQKWLDNFEIRKTKFAELYKPYGAVSVKYTQSVILAVEAQVAVEKPVFSQFGGWLASRCRRFKT